MAINLRQFHIDDCSYVWNYSTARTILDTYTKLNSVKKAEVYDTLSKICSLTPGAVKNWFTSKNGPSDLDRIKDIALYFNREYMDFLRPVRKDSEEKMDDFLRAMFEDFSSNDSSINFNTVRFISQLNELAEQTKSGFIGFSEVYSCDYEDNRIIYVDTPDYYGRNLGEIVTLMCVDELHDDIIATFDDYFKSDNCTARVIVDDEDGPFIEIKCEDMSIVVDKGRWYVCEW